MARIFILISLINLLNLRKINQLLSMIGILTKNHAYIAQTSRTFIIEDISEYKYSPSLIPNDFISLSRKFAIHSTSDSPLVAWYPKEAKSIRSNPNLGHQISFAHDQDVQKYFGDGVHIYQILDRIKSQFESRDINNVYLLFIKDCIVVFVKSNTGIDFFNIWNNGTTEELLYRLNHLFRNSNYSYDNDRIILLGEAGQKLTCYPVLIPYFREVYSDDENPFSNFV